MSYQLKLTEARELLVQHNSQVSENRIDIDGFFAKLVSAGGTNDTALSQSSWEDLQDFGLPRLLARQVATIFRSKKDEKPVLKKSQIEMMSVGDLIANYDPRNSASLVNQRLSNLFLGKRFIVFNNDASVNVAVSTKLAQEILDGYPQRELYTVDDVPSKVYAVGARPDQSFDENPLYPGRVLRPDGDCDQTNRSWSGVSLEVKQVLHLAVKQTKEVAVNSINDAHDIMDLVVGKTDEEALRVVRRRFSKASAALKELQQQGNAPSLKIFKKVSDTKSNDPFGSNRTC